VLAVTVAIAGRASAAEQWATTIGYEPEHVIVDARSTDAGRLEQRFPARPRPRPLATQRMTLNNVGVEFSGMLAALTGPGAIGTDTSPEHSDSSPLQPSAAGPGATSSAAATPACGGEDASGLTLCVTATGALRPEDRARVHAFLGGPTLVLTADAPGRNAIADALDCIAPAGRDVIVREDAARVRPGTVRIERRAP
jgi:hypothetical protein